jgi:hypothetical protein
MIAPMSGGRRLVMALLAALAVAGLAGCGGGGSDPPRADHGDTTPNNGAATQTLPADLRLPPNVPLRATGPASRSSTRVIRRWLAALDRGDLLRAAHFFALPSKFQNSGTPVLHIDSEDERIAVNLSLSCGAKAERTGGAGAYTIVLFRLTERKGPGAGCGPGTGQTARGAILVVGGLIHEWFRLPDDPSQDPNKIPPSDPSA